MRMRVEMSSRTISIQGPVQAGVSEVEPEVSLSARAASLNFTFRNVHHTIHNQRNLDIMDCEK
jgi:hypothetical protein